MKQPHIVGLGGTQRAGSTTERALRFTLRTCEKLGATTRLFAGADLSALPMYTPETSVRTDSAGDLIAELRLANGLVVGSPGYHGSISGLVKNALDYAEDMRDDWPPYFSDRPVGCIATGAGWQGVVSTLEHLRTIVHSLRGWPTPLGVALNSSEPLFGGEDEVIDEKARFQLLTVAEEVTSFVRWREGVPT